MRTWCTRLNNSLAVEDAGEDADRRLVNGPDRAGNLLEVVALGIGQGAGLIIHAMPLRAVYRRLLGR